MEALLVLLVIAIIAIPVVVIWLAFSHASLKRSVTALANEVARLKASDPDPRANTTTRQALAPAAALPRQTASAPINDLTDKQPATAPVSVPKTSDMSQETKSPPRAFVFGAANFDRLSAWLKENWVVAIAALSLAMAGIFLVQYGIENGILPPHVRVICALIFGAGLIGSGEWIRRRTRDESGTTAFVPSAFAGAGVVTLFAAILSAQQMYGLIGKETAFIGLVALAGLSLVLGWLYGTFLTVIGLLGAVAAPFITSDGTSENIDWLFYYFALISVIGLGVDAMKRSAWVSTLGLIIPYIGASLVWLGSDSEHFVAFAVLLAAAAICIPSLQTRPAFNGAMSFTWLQSLGGNGWPEFPTRLAAGGILSMSAVAILVSMSGAAGFWLALAALTLALVFLGYWFNRTTVLDDLAIPVALSILAVIGLHGLLGLDVVRTFIAPLNADLGETAPKTVTWLAALGIAISALAGWRGLNDSRHSIFWTAGAAIFAPATLGLLTLYWEPLTHMSTVQWAAHAIAVAILMTLLAEHTLRVLPRHQQSSRLQTALFVVAGLNMIAFALSVVLTETALTLGFAGIAASAAWLDRRFDIRSVSWFVQLGIIVCGYRLVADPGLQWAIETSLIELCIGFVGTILLIAAAWWLMQKRGRTGALIVAESAIWSLSGIFICILLFRAFDEDDLLAHWSLSLFGMVWLISGGAQLYRTKAGGFFEPMRRGLGMVFGLLGLLLLSLSVMVGNPLFHSVVIGPPIFDSLLVAYLLPAILLGGIAWYFDHLEYWCRQSLGIIAGGLGTLYVGLEIRRLWQGADLTAARVLEGELYSYTIAMLLAGSVTLGLALTKKSAALRKAAFAIIALTIAKVFLIDMSGLEGLTRVLSFLALGLVLAGLAMLNRWVSKALEEE